MTPNSRETVRTDGPPLKRAAHLNGVDAGRLIACLGVIWFHSGSPYNVLGYFRNPFFTILLTFLVAEGMFHPKRHPFGEFVRLRALRILVPFAIWMVLYRVPNMLAGHLVMSLTWDHLGIGLGATHLWYLPFAFTISIAGYGIARLLFKLPTRVVTIGAGVLFIAGIGVSFLPLPGIFSSDTWGRWSGFFGCVLIGPALGFLYQSIAVRRMVKTLWPAWIVLWILFAWLAIGPMMMGFGALSGLFLILASLSAPLPNWPNFWRKAGSLTYGAYLTHLAFFLGMERLHFKADYAGLVRYAIMVVGAFTCAEILQRFPWGRLATGMRMGGRRGAVRPPIAPVPAYALATEPVSSAA